MFASLRNEPLTRAVPSATKNRVTAQEEKVAANGLAIKQLHATSFGALLGRKNTALDHLKVPRRNRSPRKDIRQSSAGSLEFASANSFGCLRLWRLQLACLVKKGEGKKEKRQPLQAERSAICFGAGEPRAPGANAKPSVGFRPRCSLGHGNEGGAALPLLLRLSGDGWERIGGERELRSRLLCSQRSLRDRNRTLKKYFTEFFMILGGTNNSLITRTFFSPHV